MQIKIQNENARFGILNTGFGVPATIIPPEQD